MSVRPHPLEVNPSAPRDILNKLAEDFSSYMSSFSILQPSLISGHAFNETDVAVFSMPSSAIIEAILYDCPVVLYSDFPLCDDRFYRGRGISAAGKEGLKDTIQRALYDPDYLSEQKANLPYFNTGQGKASIFISNYLKEYLNANCEGAELQASIQQALFRV